MPPTTSLPSSQLYRTCRFHLRREVSRIVNRRDQRRDPAAASFYEAMGENGFDADRHIDVLPKHRLIYLVVPKSASNTVRFVLSALESGKPPPPDVLYKRRCSGLSSPAHAGISAFHRLAKNSDTLRFSFVRNPYARLVSAWADKIQGKPLIAGDPTIDNYRMHRASVARSLPDGAERSLSFAEFAEFAVATAHQCVDIHWQMQDKFVSVPGIALDLVGRVESFSDDINRVLDHVCVTDRFREMISLQLNRSRHMHWRHYYTDALAARVYRAYERDFDRFGYARAIGAGAARPVRKRRQSAGCELVSAIRP
jgi:Sulfotransferase family